MQQDDPTLSAAVESRQLFPGKEIDIIACQRGGPHADPQTDRIFGVRWAFLPEFGFPEDGFIPFRRVDGKYEMLRGDEWINLPRSGDWREFAVDAEARRPTDGPYFATIDEQDMGFLLPLLQLADPRVTGSINQRVLAVADFLGHVHLENAELTYHLWRYTPPPLPRHDALAQLLTDPTVAPVLVRFYQRQATEFLLALAVRFEYAALLGLGLDDIVASGQVVTYGVIGRWQHLHGEVETDARHSSTPCDPPSPTGLHAERAPGSVPHPAFVHFTGWSPPPEIQPDEADAGRQPASLLIPRVPAHFTALHWDAPPWPNRLLSYGPVLYLPERFHHGVSTADQSNAPPIPPVSGFQPLEHGELVLRPDTGPHYLDRPGMHWPPLEGWYHYRVWGLDLLGTLTRNAAETSIRHHDDLPPAAPGLRLLTEEALTFRSGDPPLNVTLEINWDAAQEFMGPDVTEFRIACLWQPRITVPVRIQSVTDVDELKVEVEVPDLPGDVDGYAGAQLTLPEGEFLIRSATTGSPGRLIIYRSAGRTPTVHANGVIFRPGVASSSTRIARVQRRPVVPARVMAVDSANPLEVRIATAAPGVPLPSGESARLYLHVLRTSFSAEPVGPDSWRVIEPAAGDTRLDALENWRNFASPLDVLNGSPVLIFPQHETTVQLMPPSGFTAGLAFVQATAADDADYVYSPPLAGTDPSLENLSGNESPAAEAALSVRSLDPPDAPASALWNPNRQLWATSAAVYVEEAEYKLDWGAAGGAANYEVWRVLEHAISDPKANHSDSDLRMLAGTRGDAFELRSRHVFAPTYRDRLPGRAPVRALYHVRAVSVAGVPGAWSDLIGPVHVPDVRRPPAPNILSAGPPRAPEPPPDADGEELPPFNQIPNSQPERPWPPPTVERTVELIWTQPGPAAGLRFDVEAYDEQRDEWGVRGRTAVEPAPMGESPEERALGRYRFQLSDVTPGREVYYHVVAVRVAADPIDPTGQTMHDICGAPSKSLPGRASGSLRPPEGLTVSYDTAAARTVLTWRNRDLYEAVDVGRKPPGGYRYEWIVTTQGDGQVAIMHEALNAGAWSYRIRARGFSRRAESEDVLVEVT